MVCTDLYIQTKWHIQHHRAVWWHTPQNWQTAQCRFIETWIHILHFGWWLTAAHGWIYDRRRNPNSDDLRDRFGAINIGTWFLWVTDIYHKHTTSSHALRRARSVLGWVTVSGSTPVWEIYLSLTNHPGQLSLAIPPWVGAMSTGRRAVMLCSWGVKAGMVHIWWQVKLCESLYSTCHIWAL